MRRLLLGVLSLALATGCATMPVPYTGVGPYPQMERGAPILPIDVLGNVLSLPAKLLLWNWKVNRHAISVQTEDALIAYLETQHLPAIKAAKFHLNEYNPGQDLSRLVKNRYVAWPYRLLLGFPITLVVDVLLPGRIFPWGDYYNPYTNTVHLYSDLAPVALHEAGHAHDFATRRYKGTYAAIRLIPFVDLYQEYKATNEAIRYLKETQDHAAELSAYKILYPAYGSYAGSYLFAPIGTIGGVLLGHAAGRSKAVMQKRRYEKAEATEAGPSAHPSQPPASPDTALPAAPEPSPSR